MSQQVRLEDEYGAILNWEDMLNKALVVQSGPVARANRSLLVGDSGLSLATVQSAVQLRASAILTTSYVPTSVIDVSQANQLTFLIDFTLGSATDALFKVEISDNQLTWRPLTISNTGTVVSDEYQRQLLTDVHKLVPSSTSASYTYSTSVQAKWARGNVKGEGTMTSSACFIAAYVGVSL